MPRALSSAVRQAIWNRSRSGQTPPAIAQQLQLVESTVRRIVRNLHRDAEAALASSYEACGRSRSSTTEQVRQVVMALRQEHPRWGAGRILVELRTGSGAQSLPCERTIQRWLQEAGLAPAPAGRRQALERTRAEAPHLVWQVDAAEQKRLASGTPISWLRVADECSGAVLKTVVFFEGHFPRVPPALVQQEFRRLFGIWGRPAVVRVDNGAPWGSWSDLPPRLALWLIGLGIDMHWNTPCRPQENGVIERSQALAVDWAEPDRCGSVSELQRRLDHEDSIQREVYPVGKGTSRLAAYPGLQHSGRSYTLDWEQSHWDWERVREHLSHYVVSRQVDSSGKIGHWGGKLYVGKLQRGKRVFVQFDPDRIEWIVSDARGTQLRSLSANLTPDVVCQLTPQPRW